MASALAAHAPTGSPPTGAMDDTSRTTFTLLAFIILGLVAVHLGMAWFRPINWDEFHYYDQVRQLVAGTQHRPVQTFHGQIYGWLTTLPGDGVDHIRIARTFMVMFLIACAAGIFLLARRFATPTASLLAALGFCACGFVLSQGSAFRTDPQAAALLMLALCLLAKERRSILDCLAFGLLTAIAALITIKVALFLPAFAGIAWLTFVNSPDRKRTAIEFAGLGFTASIVFVALFFWHSSFVTQPAVASGTANAEGAMSTVFSAGLFPEAGVTLLQLVLAPQLVILLALAPLAWKQRNSTGAEVIGLVALMLPFLSVVVYRNAFPYFYTFILPPVFVALAPAIGLLLRRFSMPVVALMLFGPGLASLSFGVNTEVLQKQKDLAAAARTMFPQDLTYIDFAAILGDHKRAVPFMLSGWGLQSYIANGEPRLVRVMEQQPVPMLVVDHPVIEAALLDEWPEEHLLPVDAKALRENYIPHWGAIWIAGKRIPSGAQGEMAQILVPGNYRVEQSAITIDGSVHQPGKIVELARGPHRFASEDGSTLRWADALPPPDMPPVTDPLFAGY